jgi:Leucine-rich repeat (LRR) protein
MYSGCTLLTTIHFLSFFWLIWFVLISAISALTKLTELHLDTNFISSLPRGLTRLSNSLKDLYLPGNTFISFPKPVIFFYWQYFSVLR